MTFKRSNAPLLVKKNVCGLGYNTLLSCSMHVGIIKFKPLAVVGILRKCSVVTAIKRAKVVRDSVKIINALTAVLLTDVGAHIETSDREIYEIIQFPRAKHLITHV